jgi:RNA 2',3'-cyclic 3'-phosphodiesterase
MRLFTAILFDENTKDTIYHTVERLHESAVGTFAERDNLHLTVNFIGETDRVREVEQVIEKAVDKAKALQFMLSIQGVGRFKRDEGDICWVGIEQENTLWRLQRELANELKEAGFNNIEDREYKPHLTLGRKVILKAGFCLKELESEVAPMQMKVEKISLMKSERIHGKLVYNEIYHVNLKESS